jgi:hypothetical protein
VEVSESQTRLADHLKRAFDAYLEAFRQYRREAYHTRPDGTRKHGLPFKNYLYPLVQAALDDWRASAGGEATAEARLTLRGSGYSLDEIADIAMEWLLGYQHAPITELAPPDGVWRIPAPASGEAPNRTYLQPDTLGVARRIARYTIGPSQQPWQYITVSLSPASPITLFDGWELAPVDMVHDAKLPVTYHDNLLPGSVSIGGRLHLKAGYGALRRPFGEGDVPGDVSRTDTRALTLPLLVLNLASDHPVHAGVSYYVEPGRCVIRPPHARPEDTDLYHFPSELHMWDRVADPWIQRRKSRKIDTNITRDLASFAQELGHRVQKLKKRDHERLIRAADQYLTVAHRTPGSPGETAEIPAMHEPETVFRWIAAIEGLLAGEDTSHSDLARKVSQRAAILIGKNDNERLQTRDVIVTAYRARSSYAHGSNPKNNVGLAELRTVIREIIVAWIVLAADFPGKTLSAALDSALLSASKREEVARRLELFWEQVTGRYRTAR